MYALPFYKEKDPKVIRQFIDDHPFAFISGCDADGKPVATQVPVFIIEEHGKEVLQGHIMRNTDHHKAFQHNPNVLVVFTGPHTYVSATWYSNPHIASTWNYMSVHVQGRIKFLDDGALPDVLRKVTMHFEGHNPDSPTVYDNLSEEFKQKYMKAIVGFEIEITGMDHVFKLSQDRDEASFLNIIRELKSKGGDSDQIALEMESRYAELFGR